MRNSLMFTRKQTITKLYKQTNQSTVKHYKLDLHRSSCLQKFKNTTNIDELVTLSFPCLDGLIQTRLSTNQSTRYIHAI